MNIYLIRPLINDKKDNFYDSAVVIAETSEQAAKMHPFNTLDRQDNLEARFVDGRWATYHRVSGRFQLLDDTWAKTPHLVDAELIGSALSEDISPHVVISSYVG